ncbi:Hypothetical protein A7982_05149 [Minicystis rosea]|nr:Hypothetical protein A7982_05149 [Minicystis rosea]
MTSARKMPCDSGLPELLHEFDGEHLVPVRCPRPNLRVPRS